MPVYRLGYLDVVDGESYEQNKEAIEKAIRQNFNIEDVNVNVNFPLRDKSVFYIAAAIVAINVGVDDSESLKKFISTYPNLFPKTEEASFALVRYMEYINGWKE